MIMIDVIVETESAEPLMKNLNADTTNLNISQETQNNYINMNRISEEPGDFYFLPRIYKE